MRTLYSFLIVTACLLFLPAAACKDAAKDTAKAGAELLVDCTKGEAAKVAGELGGVVEHVVLQAVDDTGKVDWRPVRDLAKGFTRDVGWCALSTAIARVLAPQPADPLAPQVAGLRIDTVSVRIGFAQLKQELLGPGVTFRTEVGEL